MVSPSVAAGHNLAKKVKPPLGRYIEKKEDEPIEAEKFIPDFVRPDVLSFCVRPK